MKLDDVERSLVVQALERADGVQTRAAALLGLHRDQIRYRIEKFGLKSEEPRCGRAAALGSAAGGFGAAAVSHVQALGAAGSAKAKARRATSCVGPDESPG